jgi:hypothetical protein
MDQMPPGCAPLKAGPRRIVRDALALVVQQLHSLHEAADLLLLQEAALLA